MPTSRESPCILQHALFTLNIVFIQNPDDNPYWDQNMYLNKLKYMSQLRLDWTCVLLNDTEKHNRMTTIKVHHMCF
jgi:hypothetical protein